MQVVLNQNLTFIIGKKSKMATFKGNYLLLACSILGFAFTDDDVDDDELTRVCHLMPVYGRPLGN